MLYIYTYLLSWSKQCKCDRGESVKNDGPSRVLLLTPDAESLSSDRNHFTNTNTNLAASRTRTIVELLLSHFFLASNSFQSEDCSKRGTIEETKFGLASKPDCFENTKAGVLRFLDSIPRPSNYDQTLILFGLS